MITKYLGQKDYREVSTGWVMTSCPFAPYTHPDGDDKKFSFGISTKNGFNCFTCGIKGSIYTLPKALAKYTHFYNYALEEFIEMYADEEDEFSFGETLHYINEDFLSNYPYAENVFSLSLKESKKWNIRHNKDLDIVLFPIYHDGKLHSIKARRVSDGYHYYLVESKKKRVGGWYGDWFKPRKWLVLVEGERDAIFTSNFITAWASLGSPTKKQIEKIISIPKIKLILFFDNDVVGKEMKSKFIMYAGGIVPLYEVRNYFGCKDPAELYEKGLLEKAIKSIRRVI